MNVSHAGLIRRKQLAAERSHPVEPELVTGQSRDVRMKRHMITPTDGCAIKKPRWLERYGPGPPRSKAPKGHILPSRAFGRIG